MFGMKPITLSKQSFRSGSITPSKFKNLSGSQSRPKSQIRQAYNTAERTTDRFVPPTGITLQKRNIINQLCESPFDGFGHHPGDDPNQYCGDNLHPPITRDTPCRARNSRSSDFPFRYSPICERRELLLAILEFVNILLEIVTGWSQSEFV